MSELISKKNLIKELKEWLSEFEEIPETLYGQGYDDAVRDIIKLIENEMPVKVERNRNDDIKLISEIVKREIKAENIYTFSFTLCDNDIDRDNECFSIETLIEFKKMFIGKTGIFDNEIKPVLQYPRVYKCELESVSHKETKHGLPYMKLTAYAFVEKIGDIRELMRIAEDDEKEVSVACSIMKRECSICGKNTISNGCDHVKGRIYNKKRCYYTLREPKAVYEWAIVAKSEGK